jgi:RimJ/RimL family protein N-acetyltransferase
VRRVATISDINEVYAIYMHETVVPYLSYDPMPVDDFRPIYEGLLKRGTFLIYEVDGQVAGFYEASRYYGRAQHVAYLGSLAVKPELHGSGVAREMIKDAIANLQATGAKRIELFVEVDNSRAIRFYEKIGFEIEGTLRKFVKRANEEHFTDEYIMGLLLA